MTLKVAVLFSRRGSNLEAVLKMAERNPDCVEVVCAITDNPYAPGIQIATRHKVPGFILEERAPKETKQQWDKKITHHLQGHNTDLVVLAGFMHILGEEFCKEWKGRCINIHPSLLPKYPGLNTHERVLKAGDKEHGCTVHWVTSNVDAGPIIAQVSIEVFPTDMPESLATAVLSFENSLLPGVVLGISSGAIKYQE
jgi:phosphoribosylglycinamide formyltransferase-1